MKKMLLLPLAALLSCSKSSNVNPAPPVPSAATGSAPATPSAPAATNGRLTEKDIKITQAGAADVSYEMAYTYSAAGLLINTLSTGVNVPYAYNSAGQIIQVGQKGINEEMLAVTYDAAGNPAGATDISYDLNGQASLTLNYTYTLSGGRVSQITQTDAQSKKSAYTTFTYDASGNVLTAKTYDSNSVLNSTYTYTYGTNANPELISGNKFILQPSEGGRFTNANEQLTIKTAQSGLSYTTTNRYTYSKGYPVTEVSTMVSDVNALPAITETTQYSYSGL